MGPETLIAWMPLFGLAMLLTFVAALYSAR
jgi:hypothetical protein